jgi:hypothetical protein
MLMLRLCKFRLATYRIAFSIFFYKTPLTKVHLSYQDRFQMHWDITLVVNCPLKRSYSSYQVTFSLQNVLPYKARSTYIKILFS